MISSLRLRGLHPLLGDQKQHVQGGVGQKPNRYSKNLMSTVIMDFMTLLILEACSEEDLIFVPCLCNDAIFVVPTII